jgi:hypothetical protein
MSAPDFTILTQKELTIDLSRPAMLYVLGALETAHEERAVLPNHIQCEVDNFRNTLLNLIERSEPKTENSDLIGD